MTDWQNKLFFGDNLDILRDEIPSESVDLVYLDPPFNSKATYNVLFKSPKGHESPAQIEAFDDTWHWGEQAEKEFNELVHQSNTDVSQLIQALRSFLGENDMMAYLTMMANRLLELHRALKQTGSLYLHCDPAASHYLKMVLDAVFGARNFQNEVIWQRTSAHGNASRSYAFVHDTILFYSKSDEWTWHQQFEPYTEEYKSTHFVHKDPDGRLFRRVDLRNPSKRPNLTYDYTASNGITYKPHANGWAVSKEKMEVLDRQGRLFFPKKLDGRLRRKLYLDDSPGVAVSDVWADIKPIFATGDERLGYPTQKPLSLLERIVLASSSEGDVLLDPFCGCGTAVHAAQKLNRRWIGIDITHLAISLIEKRLRDAFPDVTFEVHGTPKDADSAADLAQRDKYQFQWWACSLVNSQPYQGKKKGADSGIDGLIFFQDEKLGAKKIVVSVKGGDNINVAMIRDLGHVVDREKASIGLFVTLREPTKPMKEEAVKAGYYESPIGANFPKLQILTIDGLLNGTERAKYPDLMLGGLVFKKAKKEETDEQKKLF